jgi:fructan beta-fructosidase
MKNLTLLLIMVVVLSACQQRGHVSEQKADTVVSPFHEQHRPQFHFTPKSNWMNDPNGMVFHQGEYHLFYQYYPEGMKWGPMHWGHAISKDLVRWEHLPIALFPDSLGMIFSGSAVVDKDNSSGFGLDGNPALVAMFTYHSAEKEKAGRTDYQTQGIAFSRDNGRTWTKYDKNPVIKNPGQKDFRDPKMFWHDQSRQWITVLVAGDHAEFFGSKDLKSWAKLGEFGKGYGSHGGVWECPDLVELPAPDGAKKKWVLFISINPGAPQGGSATQYFVGTFDGKKFVCDTEKSKTLWVDFGRDNYAGVTWSNAPDDRKIFLGWMSNWAYAQEVPTSPWRSAMTMPREVSLAKVDDQYVLKSQLVHEVRDAASVIASFKELVVTDSVDLSSRIPAPLTLSITEGTAEAKDFGLIFSNSKGERFEISYKSGTSSFFVDRRRSGKVDFSNGFAGIQRAPRYAKADTIRFMVVADVSSMEVFFDDGLNVFTSNVFPNEDYTKLSLITNGETKFSDVTVRQVKSIWE